LFIDQEDDQAEIEKLCDRLLESISNLRCFENSELTVTASIGGCVMNMDFRDLDLAIKKADDALYTAKENGKNRYVLC
jgi:diguanylate cyclase (GGDEF)-like protein